MLDWIFEGIVTWISSIVSQLMDAVSGLFLNALGTDMTAMEEYFPFVSKAFEVMQYTAWALLFLITVWQLFRVFGGPITEAENPLSLLARSALFALLIGYAKPIFEIVLNIARAPYTAMMEVAMTSEDFTFAGIEQALSNGLTTFISVVSVVGLLLLVILEIALGWNYFKLLLETVERYVVVGVLCYTSPLAYAVGASKYTVKYTDVSKKYWAYDDIAYAKNIGWLNGYSDGSFRGDNKITRAEVVTVVNRATGRTADKEFVKDNFTKLNRFTDVTDSSKWYFFEVNEAANTHKIINSKNVETWINL